MKIGGINCSVEIIWSWNLNCGTFHLMLVYQLAHCLLQSARSCKHTRRCAVILFYLCWTCGHRNSQFYYHFSQLLKRTMRPQVCLILPSGPYLRTGPRGPGPGRQIFRGGILKKSRLKYGMPNKRLSTREKFNGDLYWKQNVFISKASF